MKLYYVTKKQVILYEIIFNYIPLYWIMWHNNIYIYTLNIIMLYYNIYNYLYIIQQILYIYTYSKCNWQWFVGTSSNHRRSGTSPLCALRVLISPDYGKHRLMNSDIFLDCELRDWVAGWWRLSLSLSLFSLFDFVPSKPSFDPYSICQSTSQDRYAKTNRLHHITICLKDWDVILCKSLYNMCT